ncbi:histidine kinase [Arthrobacter sp. 24S4-2]|uniref:histidine kinase n=1 Tax=Arthrobacter sp. 24S4-2 TaxID=2575374 RepID=UPI0010C783EA|nr:histidine kinase [Arthrobacter sp. 24S4-2]QCO99700.1 histidine kinase [Arthrobacter sp. 24S4-2]
MQLNQYVTAVQHQLDVAAEAGGPDARELSERLTAALESTVRLVLLEALSDAASEITLELAPASVEVRLRGRDPEFVVTNPPASDFEAVTERSGQPSRSIAAEDLDGASTSRTTLRLPDHLKQQVEQAAGLDGLSVNSWLIRAVADALSGSQSPQRTARRDPGEQNFTGWAR